ncbi:hypothetical protein SNEBB_003861 [Seison nebaliae]|nr:hypothetical protein SNEBB_003861 [Seison nebaliae]
MLLMVSCVAMFIGSYAAGIIPLAITLRKDRMRYVTVLGTGLLVGASLAVIIPEGVHLLYEAVETSTTISKTSMNSNGLKTINEMEIKQSTHQDHDHHHNDPHIYIGLSLVLGFVFMLLVDELANILSSRSPNSDLSKISTTLGLVIHSAADGLALGASALAKRADVQFIVFLAIILHKAPAAFGLVAYLLSISLRREQIRRHLLIFSLAAPVAAIVTYYSLTIYQFSPSSQMSVTSGSYRTAIAMLFSAGTFLYVATVHVLPELNQQQQTSNSTSNTLDVEVQLTNNDPQQISNGCHSHQRLSKSEIFCFLIGIALPLILSYNHKH